MNGRFLHVWAVLLLFTLFAGEALRNTFSWYGFAAWAFVVLAATVAVFVAQVWRRGWFALSGDRFARASLFLLAAYLTWASLSLIWSEYRLATSLAVAVVAATTLAAAALVLAVGWYGTLRALLHALLAIVAFSLIFEIVVGLAGQPILPVFPIDVEPGEKVPAAYYWSRALLFDGGPIQGVLGNANLLGFVALLLLITAGSMLASRAISTRVGVPSLVLGSLTLALTRSSTVLVAAVVTGVVLTVILIARRSRLWAGVALSFSLIAAAIGGTVAAPALLSALGKSEDLTGRVDIWTTVTGLFLERPVLGWGWTSYWQPWVPLFQQLAERRGVLYLQAHNAFLDVAFQLGVLGLAIFVALIVATCVAVARGGIQRRLQNEQASEVGSAIPGARSPWIFGKALPALLLAALLTQALAESRLLVEGNWALLCIIALAASGGARAPASVAASSNQ